VKLACAFGFGRARLRDFGLIGDAGPVLAAWRRRSVSSARARALAAASASICARAACNRASRFSRRSSSAGRSASLPATP